MIVLKKGIINSQIEGLDGAFWINLNKELSYKDQSQVIARAIIKKRLGFIPKKMAWDGFVYLLKKNGEFPSGLTERVECWLKDNYLSYKLYQDYNIPSPHAITLHNLPILWEHQREAIEAIKQNIRGMVKSPTGSGKSLIAAIATAEVGQFPSLLVVNRIALLNQMFETYKGLFAEPIGYIGNGVINVEKINIASIGTLCSILKIKHETDEQENLNYKPEQIMALQTLLKECQFVIIDELHHAAASTFRTLLSNLPKAIYRIGLSATPFRTDGADILLEGAFGKIIYDQNASALIKKGIICKPEITFIKYSDTVLSKKYPKRSKKDKKIDNYATMYKECITENLLYNEIVAKVALTNADMNRATLVSVTQIKHGEFLFKILNQLNNNYNIVLLHGGNKSELNMEVVKEEFKNGKIDILVSTLFDEGVDLPNMNAVVDAGGGKSAIKALQIVGRAVRKSENKKIAYIYMFIHPYSVMMKHAMERIDILQTEPEFKLKLLDLSK